MWLNDCAELGRKATRAFALAGIAVTKNVQDGLFAPHFEYLSVTPYAHFRFAWSDQLRLKRRQIGIMIGRIGGFGC